MLALFANTFYARVKTSLTWCNIEVTLCFQFQIAKAPFARVESFNDWFREEISNCCADMASSDFGSVNEIFFCVFSNHSKISVEELSMNGIGALGVAIWYTKCTKNQESTNLTFWMTPFDAPYTLTFLNVPPTRMPSVRATSKECRSIVNGSIGGMRRLCIPFYW